jgi:hypothetical protein
MRRRRCRVCRRRAGRGIYLGRSLIRGTGQGGAGKYAILLMWAMYRRLKGAIPSDDGEWRRPGEGVGEGEGGGVRESRAFLARSLQLGLRLSGGSCRLTKETHSDWYRASTESCRTTT